MQKDFLKLEMEELAGFLAHRDHLNPLISKVEVAWHIDHSLKVINRICDSLSTSNPDEYRVNFNLLRMVVWVSGKMPRGKGKAPNITLPPDRIEDADLQAQLEEAHNKLAKLSQLDKHANFDHPVFGVLHLKQSCEFLRIHTTHHLAIIQDILKQSK